MDRLLLFLTALGAFVVLCQWYVFVSMRRYLFQRYEPVTRKVAYPVLAGFGLFTVAAVRVARHADFFPPDTYGHKVASIIFFSYLGCVLALSLVFLLLGGAARTLRLKDRLFPAARVPGGEQCVCGESGCFRPAVRQSQPGTVASGGEIRPRAGEPVSRDELEPPASRRAFLKWSTAAAVVVVGGYAGKGVAEAYEPPVIEEFYVFHPSLVGIKRPLTVIQVTDFHFGMFLGSEELNRLVEMLNAIPGDAVMITGDVYHSPMSPVEQATPILRKLRHRQLGNFAILGNHDFYTGEWRSVQNLKDSGLVLLRNQWLTFTSGSAEIHLGGIDDPMVNWVWGAQFPKFPSFMDRAPGAPGFRILLSHRPSVLPQAERAGIDLVLAGHIHGGQIIFPVPGRDRGVSLASIASKYTHGWYSEGKASMYLNRGAGLTFVPWRVNCPPEITVLHLHPSDDATVHVARRPDARII